MNKKNYYGEFCVVWESLTPALKMHGRAGSVTVNRWTKRINEDGKLACLRLGFMSFLGEEERSDFLL